MSGGSGGLLDCIRISFCCYVIYLKTGDTDAKYIVRFLLMNHIPQGVTLFISISHKYRHVR